MQDDDFKMKVISEIAELQTNVSHILAAMPKKDLEGKLKFNRALILIMLASYVPILIYVSQMVSAVASPK